MNNLIDGTGWFKIERGNPGQGRDKRREVRSVIQATELLEPAYLLAAADLDSPDFNDLICAVVQSCRFEVKNTSSCSLFN